jgi:hypothetical protein
MGVPGTPESSIFKGFSIINHPFWGFPIYGNPSFVYIWVCSKQNSRISRDNITFLLLSKASFWYFQRHHETAWFSTLVTKTCRFCQMGAYYSQTIESLDHVSIETHVFFGESPFVGNPHIMGYHGPFILITSKFKKPNY